MWALKYKFWRDEWTVRSGYPKMINEVWPGAPTSIDAVSSVKFKYRNTTSNQYVIHRLTYFFKVRQILYWLMVSGKLY